MKKQWEIPESNELRVGNYVYDESEDYKIAQIEQIHSDNIHHFTKVSNLDTGEIHPSNIWKIPLTEEMLYGLADGNCIIKHISEDVFIVDRFRLIWKKSYKYWYVVDDMTSAYITKVEWVHEFQNMYYALNGKELTI